MADYDPQLVALVQAAQEARDYLTENASDEELLALAVGLDEALAPYEADKG